MQLGGYAGSGAVHVGVEHGAGGVRRKFPGGWNIRRPREKGKRQAKKKHTGYCYDAYILEGLMAFGTGTKRGRL